MTIVFAGYILLCCFDKILSLYDFLYRNTAMSKLKEMRLKRQLKAIDLAKLMGTSRQNISLAEKKGIRNMAAAKRYAAVLHCQWQEIMG